MKKGNLHFPTLSYKFKSRDKKRLVQLMHPSDGSNNISRASTLEKEYLFKDFFPQLQIHSIRGLINRITGTKKHIRVKALYIIHYEDDLDCKTVKLTTESYCAVMTFFLNKPEVAVYDSIMYLDKNKN